MRVLAGWFGVQAFELFHFVNWYYIRIPIMGTSGAGKLTFLGIIIFSGRP